VLTEKDKPPSWIQYRPYLFLLSFSLILALVATIRVPLWVNHYRTGDVAGKSIRAPYDFSLPDNEVTVKKGEIIVREGERVTPEETKKLEALRSVERHALPLTKQFVFVFLILSMTVFIVYEFATRNIKKFALSQKDLIFCLSLTLFTVFLVKVMLTVFEQFAPDYAAELFYLVPIFMFGIILRTVLFSEIVFVFAAVVGIGMAFITGEGIETFVYVFLGSLLAAYFSGKCENRTTVLKAGFFTGLIMSFLVILLHLFQDLSFIGMPTKLAFILLNGIGSSFIALGLLPVIEHIFDYTTDIRLLELANLEHPLLEDMMVNALGTYHHSIVVGSLSKAAAESIGAHPILTRVAAYYHDIGKLKMPHYFIENRQDTEDAHKNLSPNMSALIILSHTKEGVELAEKYRLGRKIMDIIRQHHGTSLVSFFYNRAKEQEDPDLFMIDEKDFRYGGPKPQTKEAGIIMLADAVEAASRTLEDPTPQRIETFVQTIVENIFVDGQLDECELTLKDLHAIQKSFRTILLGIFHHRIEYPERIEDDGAHKKYPKVVASGQKTHKKDNRGLTHLFKAAG
jgi:cyclic-di-AMP phosphodiesterase PgpH